MTIATTRLGKGGDHRLRRHAPLATIAAFLLLLAAMAGPGSAQAATGPVYELKTIWAPTQLQPGGEGQLYVQARNLGDTTSESEFTITDELPPGLTITSIEWPAGGGEIAPFVCTGQGTRTLSCAVPAFFTSFLLPAPGVEPSGFSVEPGYMPQIYVNVAVDPGASGTAVNTATLSGADGATVTDVDPVSFGSGSPAPGLVPESFEADVFKGAAYPFGSPARQGGDHPFEQRVDFDVTEETGVDDGPGGDGFRYTRPDVGIKDVEVTLPRGMVGNPEATPKCDPTVFATGGAVGNSTACPANTQVGYLDIWFSSGTHNHGQGAFVSGGALTRVAIYNLQPPKGQAADFGFDAGNFVLGHIYPNVDPGQNYAVKTFTPDISSLVGVRGTKVTFWGVPGDPAHDKFRYYNQVQPGNVVIGAPFGGAPIRPLLTNPSDCGFDNGGARIRADFYQHPGVFTPVEEWKDPLDVEGCEDQRFRFKPEIALQPTSHDAGGPTGLAVDLKVPQRNDEVEEAKELYAQNGFVKGITTPPLKKAVVTFPKGMTVNPSSAQGLESCSPAQIGMGTDSPVTCPDASQFGTLKIKTPILPIDEQPEGWIYVAKPFDNPFHSFLSLYLVIQEPNRGVLVKLAGRAELDPQTGQITFTFDDLPQLPLAEAAMTVKGGLRAGLVNPGTCGVKTIQADFYTWQDPTTPHHTESHYEVTQNPDGSPCFSSLSERPFNPNLSGGTQNNAAGSYSPLDIELNRSDEDEEIDRVEGTGPPGLLASIKGVGRCSDAAIAAAGNPERTGTEELEHPSCPADSLVGTVEAGSGTGQVLTYVPGKLYLAGPYKGAPLSGVAIVPAVAGPFDLGTVVTRTPAYINPQTAELTVKTDPLPQIFKGVPLRVRDIRVHLDRNHFTLNPTNCNPFALGGEMFSTEGKSMKGGSRFQAADCASLPYKPKLTTRLFGGTTRGSHPKFRGIFKGREGDANTKSVVVTMPRSEFLDQSHIRTVCTRVQFAAGAGNGAQCPAGSIYGHVTARTPLLDETLQGPVYLRSSNHKLPDLVADLHGIVDVEVDGRIDSIGGGIRASFESVPDVPVEDFTITMQGGKKGLLINSRNTCAHNYAATAELVGQNGKETTLKPKLQFHCSGKSHKKHRNHK
jgi:hypothetical protein